MSGVTFGGIQFFWSNNMDAALVDFLGGIGTLLVLAVFFGKIWKPKKVWLVPGLKRPVEQPGTAKPTIPQILKAWSPFVILSMFVVLWREPLWREPPVSRAFEMLSWKAPVPGLHLQVIRQPPAVDAARAEPAFYDVSWLSTVGTGTFLAGLLVGPLLGLSLGATLRIFARTLYRLRFSVLAILAMLSLGYLTRYSGMDATLGLALARTGVLFPLFGRSLDGWEWR